MKMPEGFTTVTPYIFVRDAEAFLNFLANALGGEERGRHLRPDGEIAHAEVRVGESSLMLSEAVENYPAMPASYYLYVADADASMERALRSGATLEMAVGDMPYGDRQGGVRDPFGNLWWISQRLVDTPYY